jgi:hypothetical protein
MTILTTTTTRAAINARLTHSVSRALFHQSILPRMAERGDAWQEGSTWLFSADGVNLWLKYLVWREMQIEAGNLPERSPYNIADMERLQAAE